LSVEQQQSAEPDANVLQKGSPGNMFRFNGIGTTLVGRFDHPTLGDWHFKRFAFTAFFIPLHLGRYYAVRQARRGRGWDVAGWISDREFKRRYGAKAATSFTLKAYAFPLLLIAAAIGFGIYSEISRG
jgi:hypothetical protein